jgi:ATP-dependent RNA helicase RhlE
MPPEIQKLANVLLTHPAKVEVTPPASTVDKIEQSLYHVGKMEKPELLLHLLHDKAIVNALVFTRTKHGADKVVKILQRHNIKAAAIHGNKSQNARQDALANFKNGGLRVLVATDIAARGIDIDDLSHVINFELPNIPETYVHRIGRTGRAGNTGIAISFCSREERDELKDIQKLINKTIPVVHEHPFVLSANTAALLPVANSQRQQSSFKPRRKFQSQNAGSGNQVRRGYSSQRSR